MQVKRHDEPSTSHIDLLPLPTISPFHISTFSSLCTARDTRHQNDCLLNIIFPLHCIISITSQTKRNGVLNLNGSIFTNGSFMAHGRDGGTWVLGMAFYVCVRTRLLKLCSWNNGPFLGSGRTGRKGAKAKGEKQSIYQR